jgi:hypothetical protein
VVEAVRPIPPERNEKEGDDPVRGRRSEPLIKISLII